MNNKYSKYISQLGRRTLPYYFMPVRHRIKIRNDDVFIVSYPRSGNTWIRFLLGSIIYNKKVNWDTMENYIPDIYRNTAYQLNKIKSPRYLKSHSCYDAKYPKVIYIVRDVRNVFKSYYRFKSKMSNYSKSISEFFDDFVNGTLDDFGSWDENVKTWINNKHKVKNGFLFLKYEDLRTNTITEIKTIMSFLNLDRADKDIIDAINWSSLDNMKKLEKSVGNNTDLFRESNKNISFVGNGEIFINNNNEYHEAIDKLEKKYSEILHELGYKCD